MTYTINQNGSIVRDSDGATVPVDPHNSDYIAFLQWQGAGNQVTVIVDSLADVIQQLSNDIDSQVASIYSGWTRFQQEYLLRQAAAQSFKDANYVGDPGVWVTAFADAAGLSNRVATDSILGQATLLNDALEALGAQRMRKYEILKAADKTAAQSSHDDIVSHIKTIAAALS
jgi:hypothetical protein